VNAPPSDPLDGRTHPVDVRLEIEVRATPATIWRILVAFREWPRWHRGVSFAYLEGELVTGSSLLWRADGMRIRSDIRELEPERRLGMTLRSTGARGYHRWTLLAPGPASEVTLVRSEEVWDGLAPRVLRRTLRRTLRVSRGAWLEALRERAEPEFTG
jgi:uncharacterized protein YndB with AHSA1/START domain